MDLTEKSDNTLLHFPWKHLNWLELTSTNIGKFNNTDTLEMET